MPLVNLGPLAYEVLDSADMDGKPYRVRYEDRMWIVRDSRERLVSEHFTRRDALGSIPVGGQ